MAAIVYSGLIIALSLLVLLLLFLFLPRLWLLLRLLLFCRFLFGELMVHTE